MDKTVEKRRIKEIAIIIIVMLCVGLVFWGVQSTYIIHRICKSISPDGTNKVEIYNVPLMSNAQNSNENTVTIKQYSLGEDETDWNFLRGTELEGTYRSSHWSEDGKVFIVNMDSSKENLYLFDKQGNNMRILDSFFDMQIISAAPFNSPLYRYMLSKNEMVDYEFVQWAKDSDLMLIRYAADFDNETSDSIKLNGYFWYNYEDNCIKGLVQTSD